MWWDDKPVDNSPRAWIVGIFWFLVFAFALIGATLVCVRLIGG